MITPAGIDKIEQFFLATIGKAQFVSGGTAYDAQTTEIELMTAEDRLMIIAMSGPDLPAGAVVNEMRLLAKDNSIFASDPVNMVRSNETEGLYYVFRIRINQQEV